jgi:hypothetical protein
MFSPFEELEHLAEHLPDEGECLLISRRDGELVYEPFRRDDLRDGVDEANLYGRLVQANERLNSLGTFPIWVSALFFVTCSVVGHATFGNSWPVWYWYMLPLLGVFTLCGCFHWIRWRQEIVFQTELLPSLRVELRRRKIDAFSLISGVQQHPELRTLLQELVRWAPGTDPTPSQLERRK